jgi:metal-sulfur cluster biosynthetic enzyme
MALWLEHRAEKFSGIEHGGAPNLHYAGHGHVWSRYPANHAAFQAGASIRQRNAYAMLPYAGEAFGPEVERLRHQLLNPPQLEVGPELPAAAVQAEGALARPGETSEAGPLKEAIWQALRLVKDEQLYTIDASVVDLGLIYDVRVRQGTAQLLMTMPHRGRPVHDFFVSRGGGRLEDGIRERLLRIPGIERVVVDLVWNPPWTAARLTAAGRKAIGLPSK